MCPEHEVACLFAVMQGDYESLARQIAALNIEVTDSDYFTAAKLLAVTRLESINQSDPELVTELAETIEAMPTGCDETDFEWALVKTIRSKFNE
jgi:hypothetical protein